MEARQKIGFKHDLHIMPQKAWDYMDKVAQWCNEGRIPEEVAMSEYMRQLQIYEKYEKEHSDERLIERESHPNEFSQRQLQSARQRVSAEQAK